MKRFHPAMKALCVGLISFWYWFILGIIRIRWIVPGAVASIIMIAFALITRKDDEEDEYRLRFAFTYIMGLLITFIISMNMHISIGVCIASAILMPCFVSSAMYVAHEI